MKVFSKILNESRASEQILKQEITKYLEKVKKILPEEVSRIIYITQKYNLDTKEILEEIKTSSKGGLQSLSKKLDIPFEEIVELQGQLKSLKQKIRLLPQYQSKAEREEVEAGRLALSELTIDLKSTSGRNAAAKIFMPVVLKVVNSFAGKSNCPKEDLISVAMEGMTDAMNQWDPELGSFKTYLGFRVRQAILNHINSYNEISSGGNSYSYKNGLMGGSISIDKFFDSDDDDDKLTFLGIEDPEPRNANELELWGELYKLIETNFNNRKAEIFYRFFGINGYKREKSTDIAKSFGMHISGIRNNVVNPILKFFKSNKKASDLLLRLKDIYTESLMTELFGVDIDIVKETLINDDTFILLEDITRWDYKAPFLNAMRDVFSTLDEKTGEIIRTFLTSDFNYLDKHYKQYIKEILQFLNLLYPYENFNQKTDVDVLEYMEELQKYYQKYNN